MNLVIVEIQNSINSDIILKKEYSNNTLICSIIYDILDILQCTDIELYYNDKIIYREMILKQITEEKHIIISMHKKYKICNKNDIQNYIIEYYKSYFKIYLIDYISNKISKSYMINLKVLKIINFHCQELENTICYKHNLTGIHILTTNYDWYVCKIIDRLNKYEMKLIKKNIKNIFFKYDEISNKDSIITLSFNGEITIIPYFEYDNNIKIILNIDIDINNIKNIEYAVSEFLFIETYDNMINIIYNKITKNILNIVYKNVKKIVHTSYDLLILTYDNNLYSVKNNLIYENKFIDIISRQHKDFYCGILEDRKIKIFGKDIKEAYNITPVLNEYLINIKEVKLCDRFMYTIDINNTCIIWGPLIKYNNNKPFIIFNNVENTYEDYNKLIIIININIIIINNWYKCYDKESIITISHPLSYKYISNYIFGYFDKLYATTYNNTIVELCIDYDTDYENNNNIYGEYLNYRIKILNYNINKLINLHRNAILYLNTDNEIFISFVLKDKKNMIKLASNFIYVDTI
jgi:hypothetical protein